MHRVRGPPLTASAQRWAPVARRLTASCVSGTSQMPAVHALFDKATSTLTYLVYDPETKDAVVIDPVLNFDLNSFQTKTEVWPGLFLTASPSALCCASFSGFLGYQHTVF